MTAFHFEAKKYALRQAKDGVIVSFVVHPDDVVPELLSAPIGEHYVVALAPYTEEEQRPPSSTGSEHGASIPAVGGSNPPADTTPPKTRKPFYTLPRSQQAAIACADHRFRWWLSDVINREIGRPPPGHPAHVETTAEAAEELRRRIGVQSRRELDTDEPAGQAWDHIHAQFRSETGLQPEER